jgi:3-methyladenine DNA glycosylase AlkD
MDFKEAMAALEAAGTEQNRKVYPRHGVRSPMFGVSFANLEKVRKRIRRDHGLAAQLWRTGNHDARMLATMIADPAEVSSSEIEAWIADCDNYVLTDALAKLVAASPHARAQAERWIPSENEWASSAGWMVIGGMLVARGETLPAGELDGLLARIERDLSRAPNRTRYAMNGVLIGIGCVSDAFATKAIAAARRIGPVEVDHGETGCKTPDAVTYIPKARAYFAAKAARGVKVAEGTKSVTAKSAAASGAKSAKKTGPSKRT